MGYFKGAWRRLLALGVLGLALGSLVWWGTKRASTGRSHVQRASKPAPPARRYAEPLLGRKDLPVDESVQVTDEDATLARTQFAPRADRPAWDLELPLDWSADPYGDRNWRFNLNSLGMTFPLLSRYAQNADSALYRSAVAFALDWWSYHHDRGKESRYSWYDMAVGVRASVLAYLLDRSFSGREQLAPEQERALLEMAGEHVERLAKRRAIARSNHGLFQIQGLLNLCRVLGPNGVCAELDGYIEQQLSVLLDDQFDAHGVHREHSPGYHAMAIDVFAAFGSPGGQKIYQQIAERLVKARAVLPWLVFPTGRLAALGDTEGEATLAPPPDRKCDGASPAARCVEVGDFSESGYLVVRSPWTLPVAQAFMLIMTGSYYSTTHKHVDDLSFELMERGELIFEDAGKYAYLHDQMSDFVHSARAHNTVGLAERELTIHDTKPYGSGLNHPQPSDGVYALSGRVRRKDVFTHERRIDYRPERYLIVTDLLSSSDKHKYEAYLHLAAQLQARREGDAFSVALAGGRSMRIEALSDNCTLSEERGVLDPRIQGWVTKRYREMVPATALTVACTGRKRTVRVLVSFDAAGREQALAELAKSHD